RLGELDRATEVVQQMPPSAMRDRTRWYVAEQARGMSPPDWMRQHAWHERAQFRTEAEDRGEYHRLADQAYSLAKAGRIAESYQHLREIPTPQKFSGWAWKKARRLQSIASALLEAGAGPRAALVLQEARATCEGMQDGALWEAAECFDQIARLLMKAGARE